MGGFGAGIIRTKLLGGVHVPVFWLSGLEVGRAITRREEPHTFGADLLRSPFSHAMAVSPCVQLLLALAAQVDCRAVQPQLPGLGLAAAPKKLLASSGETWQGWKKKGKDSRRKTKNI